MTLQHANTIFRPLRNLGLVALMGASVAACTADTGNLRNAARANLASETALNAQIISDRARAQRCDRDRAGKSVPAWIVSGQSVTVPGAATVTRPTANAAADRDRHPGCSASRGQ